MIASEMRQQTLHGGVGVSSDAASIDLQRDATHTDLRRDAASILLCRDAAPTDLRRDAARDVSRLFDRRRRSWRSRRWTTAS